VTVLVNPPDLAHSPVAMASIITHPPGHPAVSSYEQNSVATKAHSCDDNIRNRLLFKLGIYNPNFTKASIHHKIRLATRTSKDNTGSLRRVTDPEDVVMSSSSWFDEHESSYLIPLKLGRDHIMIPSTSPPSSLLGLWSLQQKQQHSSFSSPNELHADDDAHHQRPVYVHFNSSVTVIPIPSRSYDHIAHHDQLYSNSTKTTESSTPTNTHVCHIKPTKSERDLKHLVVDISTEEVVPPPRSGIAIMLEEAGMI
jgi:hypothetical protein